jgi:hypothetical protein
MRWKEEIPCNEKRVFAAFNHPGEIIYRGIRICMSVNFMKSIPLPRILLMKALIVS